MSAIDDQFERELDAWWNEEVLNLPHPPRPSLPAADLALIHDLHASHAPAAPSPAFAQSLRENLMNQASSLAPDKPAMTPTTTQRLLLAQPAFPVRNRPSSRRWSTLANLAAVLLVIFALAATSISGAPRSLWTSFFQQAATPIPAADTNTVVTYRGDSGRTGAMPGSGPAGALKIAWQQLLVGVNATPIYANGRLFVNQGGNGKISPHVAALDLKTGQMLWRATVGSNADAIPAVDERYVYVVTDKQTLVALSQESGEVVWTYLNAGGTFGVVSPAVADGLVLIKTGDQKVRAIDATTGKERWRSSVPSTNEIPPPSGAVVLSAVSLAVSAGVVYAAGDGGVVYALNASDGHQLWSLQTKGEAIAALAVADGAVYVLAQTFKFNPMTATSTLYALNAADGDQLWRIDNVDPGQTLAVRDKAVYVAGSLHGPNLPADSLAAFDAKDGHKLWTAGISAASAPVVVAGTVYVAAGGSGAGSNSYLYAVNAAVGSVRWKTWIGPTAPPLVVDGFVIVPTITTIMAIGGDGSGVAPFGDVPLSSLLGGLCSPPRTVPAGTATPESSPVVAGSPEIGTPC